jgi:nucleoside-diphosphate-sugar epimerase
MVLVTGGTGLVGSHLLLELVLKGTKARAIYRSADKLENVKKVFSYYVENPSEIFNKIEWVQGDILDIPKLELAFKDVTRVYHAAAFISFDPKDFKKLKRINTEGTTNIVNLCIDHKIEKLCYASTIGTISRGAKGAVLTEENEWSDEHANVYALTKYSAEMEVWRASQENVPVVIINPGVILGPGFWDTGSGSVFSTVNKGYSYYPPGGTGFVSVSDVIKIMIGLMESHIRTERFIIVGENLSFKEIMTKIALKLGKKPPRKRLKIWQLQIGRYVDAFASLITGRKRKITKNSIYSLKYPKVYSSAKIKNALNFEFEPLEKTIKLSSRHFLAKES